MMAGPPPRRRSRPEIHVVAALAALAALLAFAAVRHDAVTLTYAEGNGCRSLTAAAAAELADAMRPVRLLVALWVVATGLALVGRLAASLDEGQSRIRILGALSSLALAGVSALATGAGLMDIVPLWVLLAPMSTFAALVLLARSRAARAHPAGPRFALLAGWTAICGIALPIALLWGTGSGEFPFC
jgi:hypothetical protein